MSWKPLLYAYMALPILLAITFIIWSTIRLRRTTRWPISQKLLRPPGESLRRKLAGIDENVLLYFCIVMTVWCACLVGMFQIQKLLAPNSWTAFFAILGVGVIFAILGAWWINRYMRKRADYALGFYGEGAVGEELNQLLRAGCHVFHDFSKNRGDNIDHIIVAPSGVYVVETKARRKRRARKGKPDHIITFDGDALIYPHGEQSRYGLDQARDNARCLSVFLSSATGIEKIWVEPILTFPGWMINRRITNASVQVLNPKEIADFVLGRPVRLSREHIERIRHQLDQKCRDVDF